MATVEQARKVKALLAPLTRHVGNGAVIEQAAIAGALDPAILSDPERGRQTASYLAKRLDALAGENERGWQGALLPDGGLEFSRSLRGVTERHVVDGAVIRSAEARRVDAEAADLQAVYGKHGTLKTGERDFRITGPVALLDAIMTAGRKGVSIQRYKGLGEMNPDQLWETTLDPDARSLLQVKVPFADEADGVFETLMGDAVEPRRQFIQSHALEVVNLDV